jgi:hypothetical protein
MKLQITIDGVSQEVTPKLGDLVRFERQYDVPASSLDDNARIEYVFYIAWLAMSRTGDYQGDFESFLDVVEVGEPVPLEPPTSPSP